MASPVEASTDAGLTIVSGSVCDTIDSSVLAAESNQVPIYGKQRCEEEIDRLVKYFIDEEGSHAVPTYWRDSGSGGNSIQRKKIVAFLEGSRLPFSSLVTDVFERLSGDNDQDQSKTVGVTLASVRSIVLSLGERISFGITKPDTDVLEDDTPRSLWRWEARNPKLLLRSSRDEILDRRRWRRKIAQRIAALSAVVDAISPAKEETPLTEDLAYLKAVECLSKTDDESAIRAARIAWQHKKACAILTQQSNADPKNPLGEQPSNLTQVMQESTRRRRQLDPEEKERLRQEKLLKRQQAENEKEQKRKEKEDQKRKEKEEGERKKQEKKRQEEAEKDQKRERKKQEKKQQEDAEKEQKRDAERKKQLALKKQASFMDRFLVRKDQATCGPSQQAEVQAQSQCPAVEVEKRESASDMQALETASVVARMDVEMNVDADPERLWQAHVNHWLVMRNQYASQKTQGWGARRKPKVSVYRELRLQGTVADSRPNSQDHNLMRDVTGTASPSGDLKRPREEFDCSEELVNGTEFYPSSPLDDAKKFSSGRYNYLRNKRRKLLQFDKSHRPPYYGTFSKKSDYISARHPLKQDPVLDYEVDSDEEWEEEDPGESLSDDEKDEEDEKVEIEDEYDEEDGDEFVVPDGYLSEDEGVAMEDAERGASSGEASSTQSPAAAGLNHNMMSAERLQKVLDNATEHALRSNRPLVVSNLGQIPGCEEEASTSQLPSNRIEYFCLEALRIRVVVPNLPIGVC